MTCHMFYAIFNTIMRISLYIISLAIVITCLISGYNAYSEEAYRDMYVSVVILPNFKLNLDNPNINFGFTDPGKTVELYPDKNYNEVKCISNKGTKWYLRVAVSGDIVGPQGSSVALRSFKWMVASSSGDGIIEKDWHPFSAEPVLVYTSGPKDMAGDEVTIKFKYKLDLPGNARGGNYGINIVYTMTDVP